MRYFAKLAFDGTAYAGWQRQPNAHSVQSEIENCLSTVFRQTIEVMGCGRTDAGVHAREFYLHFDLDMAPLHAGLPRRLNGLLPDDIAFDTIFHVDSSMHARFSATEREYKYILLANKDPFIGKYAYDMPGWKDLDQEKMQEAAGLLLEYDQFFPFCKTDSDARHYQCDVRLSAWEFVENCGVFTIRSNRFLRGMVRLIVGMCLEVGMGKLDIEEIRHALESQTQLSRALSAPASGLALTRVHYPFHKNGEDRAL